MASITRSNRRAEGLHPYDRNVNASPLTRPAPGPNSFHHGAAAAGGRTKRSLDVAERDLDALRHKKTRIAVEILAKPQLPREPVNVQPPIPRRAAVASSASTSRPPPPAAPVPPTRPAASTATTSTPAPTLTPAPISAAAADPEPPNASLTKHQAKVINGIRHELDRLQPRPDDTRDTKEQGRKLRSQEATRFKSELSAYFPDYDEVIGNEPKEQREQPFLLPTLPLLSTSSLLFGRLILTREIPARCPLVNDNVFVYVLHLLVAQRRVLTKPLFCRFTQPRYADYYNR